MTTGECLLLAVCIVEFLLTGALAVRFSDRAERLEMEVRDLWATVRAEKERKARAAERAAAKSREARSNGKRGEG